MLKVVRAAYNTPALEGIFSHYPVHTLMPLGMQDTSMVVVAVYEVEVLVEVVVSQYSKNFACLKTFGRKIYISSLSSFYIGLHN